MWNIEIDRIQFDTICGEIVCLSNVDITTLGLFRQQHISLGGYLKSRAPFLHVLMMNSVHFVCVIHFNFNFASIFRPLLH